MAKRRSYPQRRGSRAPALTALFGVASLMASVSAHVSAQPPKADTLAGSSLCLKNEAVVFACHIANKEAALCRPLVATSPPSPAMVYRFGIRHRIERAYPDPQRGERGAFFVSSGQPTKTYTEYQVNFVSEGNHYVVFGPAPGTAASAAANQMRGLSVSRAGLPVFTGACDGGEDGFREVPKPAAGGLLAGAGTGAGKGVAAK